jgi:hypothetical protein
VGGRAAPDRPRPPSLSFYNISTNGSYLAHMAQKRQSLKLDEIDWQALMGIAANCGCEYRSEPSWRRLIDYIASGKLTVMNRPDKRTKAFQNRMRRPMIDQQVKRSLAKIAAKAERDRQRQEQKRRAAGILPRSISPPPMPFTITMKSVNSPKESNNA